MTSTSGGKVCRASTSRAASIEWSSPSGARPITDDGFAPWSIGAHHHELLVPDRGHVDGADPGRTQGEHGPPMVGGPQGVGHAHRAAGGLDDVGEASHQHPVVAVPDGPAPGQGGQLLEGGRTGSHDHRRRPAGAGRLGLVGMADEDGHRVVREVGPHGEEGGEADDAAPDDQDRRALLRRTVGQAVEGDRDRLVEAGHLLGHPVGDRMEHGPVPERPARPIRRRAPACSRAPARRSCTWLSKWRQLDAHPRAQLAQGGSIPRGRQGMIGSTATRVPTASGQSVARLDDRAGDLVAQLEGEVGDPPQGR